MLTCLYLWMFAMIAYTCLLILQGEAGVLLRRPRSVFRQLVATGLLEVDIEGHGALRLTAASAGVLRGERSLALRTEPPAAVRRRERVARTGEPAIELPAEAAVRFESLRNWRAETARTQNVPAYVIFHDATLREIALAQPDGLDMLASISGVGAGRLERYGRAVLDTLAATTPD